MKCRFYSLALGLVALFLAFSASAEPILDPGVYEQLYPVYAEYCGLSQIIKKPGFGLSFTGGSGGHGVLYLHGACRDLSSPYPRLKVCEPREGGSPGTGTGISVNSDYRNVNWSAIAGKRFFFAGDLQPGERVNPASYQRTLERAQKMDLMRGIEFHPEQFENALPGMSNKDYMYESALGTDYAISFGRNMYCAKTPLAKDQLSTAIAFLNDLNRYYYEGRVEFRWNVFSNNCTHTAHNALAAAGFWGSVAVDAPAIFQIFQLVVPINSFVDQMRQSNELPLDDLIALYLNKPVAKGLLEHNRLPTEPGGLAEYLSVQKDNDLYGEDLEGMLIDLPLLHPNNRAIERYLTQPRYFEVEANLLYFRGLYQKLQREKRGLAWYEATISRMQEQELAPINLEEFIQFYQRFYQYLDKQSLEVEQKLRLLRSLR